ncbi:MAG: phage tail sheath C-terminal domain-containing protein [Bacteroidota bacterium]
MADYKTPGLYIEEVRSATSSTTSVATAIPAFIGYTEMAGSGATDLTNVPTAISSLLEFEAEFGGAPAFSQIQVDLDADLEPVSAELTINHYLYRSLQLFFENGGGECYIVSVGGYSDAVQLGDTSDPDNSPGLLVGLSALERQPEPTLLVCPDACLLSDATELGSLHQAMLAQCGELGDRFAILDLFTGDEGAESDFRDQVGTENLNYGAAYHPWLAGSLSFDVNYDRDIFQIDDGDNTYAFYFTDSNGVISAELKHSGSLTGSSTAEADLTTLEAASYTGAAEPLVYDPVPAAYDPIAYTTLQSAGETIKGLFDQVKDLYGSLTHEHTQDTFTDLLADYTSENGDQTLAELLEDLFVLDKSYKSVFGNTSTAALEVLVGPSSDTVTVSNVTATEEYDSLIPASGSTNNEVFHTYLEGRSSNKSLYRDEDENYTEEAAWDEFCTLYDATAELVAELLDSENESFLGQMIDDLEEETGVTPEEEITEDELQALEGNSSWSAIRKLVLRTAFLLPPSATLAGVYTQVDADRGVWKAPANISLNSVNGTSLKINDRMQGPLNVDSTGKSINVVRAFTGQGILVWGARTLMGNDSEWRYVPTRRLFNYVEESLVSATRWAVFEPNDAKTWVRIRGLIDNFLNGLWRQGALTGAKRSEAYFVRVGKGSTMTEQDILDGKLIVEVGLAAVRPAEFIILKFQHLTSE